MGYILHGCPNCNGDLWPDPDGDGYVCIMCSRAFRQKVVGLPHARPTSLMGRTGPETKRQCAECHDTYPLEDFHKLNGTGKRAETCKHCALSRAVQHRADAGELYQQQPGVKRLRGVPRPEGSAVRRAG